jgi:hypothetical protein
VTGNTELPYFLIFFSILKIRQDGKFLSLNTGLRESVNSIQDIPAGLFVMFLSNATVTEELLNWKLVSTGNLIYFPMMFHIP